MSVDFYMRISCPNCESQYAVDFMKANVEGSPDYCPFCGEEIPEDDMEEGYEEEQEDEGQW